MTDGPLRAALKAVVRAAWSLEWGLRRRLSPPQWRLGGACGSCAKCCEAPTVRSGWFTWHLRSLRWAFLTWQRVVNGFELVEARRRLFTFRCTHFDPLTRRCDSYATRPFMCRDYPRALLHQPWPELFEGCGFRVVAADAERQAAALEGLDPETAERLRERLRLR